MLNRLSAGSSHDGAGFGLVITRQTIEAHGGRISVESEQGANTTFSVWLPVREEVKRGADDRAGTGTGTI